jgi:hypothetical protein
MAVTVLGTDSFFRNYERSSIGLQNQIEGAVKDLRRIIQERPKDWKRNYDRVEGLQKKVLEVKVTGANRLLALDEEEKIILWRTGGHDLIKQVQANRPNFPTEYVRLPHQFDPAHQSRFFPSPSSLNDSLDQLEQFPSENSREWIYELADEQYAIGKEVADQIEGLYCEDDLGILMISGGPGTGKTAILLWLLKRLSDLESESLKLKIRLEMPAQVLRQVRNTLGCDLDRFIYESEPDVVLIDDPDSFLHAKERISRFKNASVVVGLDPLQMEGVVTDFEYENFAGMEFVLSTCYRQKEQVGRAAKHVIDQVAKSSPYLAHEKKVAFSESRTVITYDSNEVNFANPGGSYQMIEADQEVQLLRWHQEMRQLLEAGRLWTHSEPLLVVLDEQVASKRDWDSFFSHFANQTVHLEEAKIVKGVDFQHAVMLFSGEKFRQLDQGFEGLGKKSYNQNQLLRIPFSRPKDSLAIFVF